MNLPDFSSLDKWRAFKVPVFGIVVMTLLVAASTSTGAHTTMIPPLATYIIGASIISYAHSIAYSTHMNRQKEKPSGADQNEDLPNCAQALFVSLHALWFAFSLSPAFPIIGE